MPKTYGGWMNDAHDEARKEKCDTCGERHYPEYMRYPDDGGAVCQFCYDDAYVHCWSCGKEYNNANVPDKCVCGVDPLKED